LARLHVMMRPYDAPSARLQQALALKILTVNGIWRRAQAARKSPTTLRRKAAMTSTDQLLCPGVENEGRQGVSG
jgi:hypothetical protein